jgi:putative ABC transport system permease protein
VKSARSSRVRRLGRGCLSLILPPDSREHVLADLDEEFDRHIAPDRSPFAASAWYWRQLAGSVRPALAMRRRRRAGLRARGTAGQSHVRVLAQQTAQDIGFALRFFRQRPGFAAAAVATFALGIGVNTALFSIVYGVLLRPLPFPEPDRLVRIWSANPRGIARNSVSPPDFWDLRKEGEAARAFDSIAGYFHGDVFALQRDEPVRAIVTAVTPNLFATLGAEPASGRVLAAEDSVGQSATVVVLSDPARRRWFGAQENVVGRSVRLNGRAYTVVGVMPPTFAFPAADTDFWMPLPDSMRSRQRSARWMDVIGRLSPAISASRGEEVLRTIAGRLAAEYPRTNTGWSATVVPLRDSIVGDSRRPLLVLLGGVLCVLLIACANVTSLLLARGVARSHEFAVRAALGAGRGRMLRQQLVESSLLALAGGAVGLLLAYWGLESLKATGGYPLPRLDEVRLEPRLLAFSFAISVVTGVGAGLVPAWRASRAEAGDALKSARVAGAGRTGRRTRSVLVVAEIALTVALLVCAGLLVRSFATLVRVDAGFRADHVLLAEMSIPSYPVERWTPFFMAALDEIRTLPGVQSAGAGAPLPLAGSEGLMRFGLLIDGREVSSDGRADRVYLRWATPDYFRAMGIPLVQGRAFTPADGPATTPVAVVDETFVRRHFPAEDPLGKRVRASNDRTWREIVGVVGAVHQTSLEQAPDPHLYVVPTQSPSPTMTFVVRSTLDPESLSAALRDRVRRLDPALPAPEVRRLDEVVSGSVASRRFNAIVLTLFALLAATLTLVGIYGVVAYWVNDSAREIGVRMALGAGAREILVTIVGRSLILTACGCAAGLVLALAAGRSLAGLLFGVSATDPVTFAGATAAVTGAAILASYLPARRALRIDPAQSLRAE